MIISVEIKDVPDGAYSLFTDSECSDSMTTFFVANNIVKSLGELTTTVEFGEQLHVVVSILLRVSSQVYLQREKDEVLMKLHTEAYLYVGHSTSTEYAVPVQFTNTGECEYGQ